MPRKRFADMTDAELEAYDASDRYTCGRRDAFDHGKPETILKYWEREEPTLEELCTIVKNLLSHHQGEEGIW